MLVVARGLLVVALFASSALAQPTTDEPTDKSGVADPWPTDPAPADPAPPEPKPVAKPPVSDEFIDPSQLPPDSGKPPPPPPIPRALVDRTLILPSDNTEATIAAGVGRVSTASASLTYGALSAAARVGLSPGELFVRIEVVPIHDGNSDTVDVPVFQRLDGGMAFRITRDTGVGPRFTIVAPDSKLSGYAPSLFVRHKERVPGAAIVVEGAVQYADQFVADHDTRSIGVAGTGALQIQVMPAIAVEATGTIVGLRFIDAGHPGRLIGESYAIGADATIAVNRQFDVIPLVSFIPIGDLNTTKTLIIGLELAVH